MFGSRILIVVILISLFNACSSGVTRHRAFRTTNWQMATSCDPVDIQDTQITTRRDPVFQFGEVSYRRIDDAGGPVYELSEGASLHYEGKRYNVRLLRVVAPSEHRVLGMHFLMELQFFAVADDGTPLGFVVFVRKGKARLALRTLIENDRGKLLLADLKPVYGGHYYYQGAMPLEPCYRISYVVMKSAIEASVEDIDVYLRRWPYVERTVRKAEKIEETP